MYRFNGENWFKEERSIFTRIRQWFIWFGGWESPWGKWHFFVHTPWYKQWWKKWHFKSPVPLSILGHWATYYGWGIQAKLPSGWLVWCWNKNDEPEIYISKDGTPENAHAWLKGTPKRIIEAAEQHQAKWRKNEA